MLVSVCIVGQSLFSQISERARDESWNDLVKGGRFADRFLPMKGECLSFDTWGDAGVFPRFVDNGIEDRIWSYWGGNIVRADDGQFHLLVCGWLECSPKGHMEWGNSYAFNAISDKLEGPYKVRNLIGKGHNPEVYRLKDGRYVLYVIDGYYVADDLNGQWTYGKFDFDPRDRPIIEGLSNLSFAQREDGSYLMVCRGGGIWVSKDGITGYHQVSDHRVYPPVEGRFEDPVIWRDHIQYHMIVNDWLGRVAFYLRSANGIDWVVDPGEAYMPGIALHPDGQVENWFKFERMKVFQDKYGRAIQANFAVIDTLKKEDKASDIHSSKNITIPLNPGLLLEVLNTEPIDVGTDSIRVKIVAEPGFDPSQHLAFESLRFGASAEVDFGKGCNVRSTENVEDGVIVTFDGNGSGIQPDEFAPKLLGKRKDGQLVYGYARLPYYSYLEPLMSSRKPVFHVADMGQHRTICKVVVENFGQIKSRDIQMEIGVTREGHFTVVASGQVPDLEAYGKINLEFPCISGFEPVEGEKIEIRFLSGGKRVRTEQL